MYSFFSFECFSQTKIFNKLGPCLLCRVDLGFAMGDWVRAVHIAFWDSVTAFSFQKDERRFFTKFVLKNICCIMLKNYLQKISGIYWLVADDIEGKDINYIT